MEWISVKEVLLLIISKKCIICKIEKNKSEFYLISKKINTLRSICKSCELKLMYKRRREKSLKNKIKKSIIFLEENGYKVITKE